MCLTLRLITLPKNLFELCIRHRVVHQDLPSRLTCNRRRGRGNGRRRSATRLGARIRFAIGGAIRRSYRGHRARASRCIRRGLRDRLRRCPRRRLRWRLNQFTHIRTSRTCTPRHNGAANQQQAREMMPATALVMCRLHGTHPTLHRTPRSPPSDWRTGSARPRRRPMGTCCSPRRPSCRPS
jgi:hypothetical protein